MDKEFKMLAKDLEDTDKIARAAAHAFKQKGGLICLYGDIGSGKTTFVKSMAKHLGIKEKVTSPSFVILNEYRTDNLILYHFDLYRLEEEGIKTILEELREYSEGENSLAVIEWAEFSSGELPENRLEIRIKYLHDDEREFIFSSFGEKYSEILEEIKKVS